jgi:hypothetical protein
MKERWLTDEERRAFKQEVTRGWALDYFFHFDNAPLHFVYRDGVIPGELSEVEQRNKAITESTWIDAYNYGCIATIHNAFLFRKGCLQVPFQSIRPNGEQPGPISEESSEGRKYRTAEGLQADLDAWMADEGWQQLDDRRRHQAPARNDWSILLAAPDRTMRFGSVIYHGNQAITETIISWSEDGVIKETAMADLLYFDVDGLILNERAYIDTINWPASPGTWGDRAVRPKDGVGESQLKGGYVNFLNRYADRDIEVAHTKMETRNLQIIEETWIDAFNSGSPGDCIHPARYRVQLPLQKISYGAAKSEEIERAIMQAVPDRQIQLVRIYAKGNQIVVECVISWTEDGVYRETPFIAFLLLDQNGLIIRDRRYLSLDHWPGAEYMP